MRIALEIIFVISVIGWGIILNYCSRYKKVIEWAATLMYGDQMTKQESNTVQAAISPKQYLSAINFQLGLPFVVLVAGSLLHWYLGILGVLISVMVIYAVMSRVRPGSIDAYLHSIIADLDRRAADFEKSGDKQRQEAATENSESLKQIYGEIRTKGYKIPSSGIINLSIN